MKRIVLIAVLTFCLIYPLSACQNRTVTLGQQEALEIAWKTLKPNTLSHNRDYWEIHEAQKVYGKDVVNEFTTARIIPCPGPDLPENMPIKISSEYWYIKVVPHPEVRVREEGTSDPQFVQVIPEPNIVEAIFLIDMYDGDVIARKLTCQ